MIKINSLGDWEKLLDSSKENPVIIFKHSSTCSISAGAYSKMEKAEKNNTLNVPIHIVIVQEAREVSNKIAEDLSITHQSPQVIVIRDRKAAYDESHDAIDPEKVSSLLLTRNE